MWGVNLAIIALVGVVWLALRLRDVNDRTTRNVAWLGRHREVLVRLEMRIKDLEGKS